MELKTEFVKELHQAQMIAATMSILYLLHKFWILATTARITLSFQCAKLQDQLVLPKVQANGNPHQAEVPRKKHQLLQELLNHHLAQKATLLQLLVELQLEMPQDASPATQSDFCSSSDLKHKAKISK